MSLAQVQPISTTCRRHASLVNAKRSSATVGTMMPARNGMHYVVGVWSSRMAKGAHRDCGWTKFVSIRTTFRMIWFVCLYFWELADLYWVIAPLVVCVEGHHLLNGTLDDPGHGDD